MPRQSVGSFNITRLEDGLSPVTGFLSRPLKIFAANQDGSVPASEFESFTTTLTVFEGSTKLVATLAAEDAALGLGEYRLADSDDLNINGIVTTGAGFPSGTNYDFTDGVISAPSTALSATSGREGTIQINVRARTSRDTIVTFSLFVELDKQQDGVGGKIIQLDSDKLIFTSDFDGVLDDSQTGIILDIYPQGNPGAQRYWTSLDGGGFKEKTTVGTAPGEIAGFDHNRMGDIADFVTESRVTTATFASPAISKVVTYTVTGSPTSDADFTLSIAGTDLATPLITGESAAQTADRIRIAFTNAAITGITVSGTGADITFTGDEALGDFTTEATKTEIGITATLALITSFVAESYNLFSDDKITVVLDLRPGGIPELYSFEYAIPNPRPADYNLASIVLALSGIINANEHFTTLNVTDTTFDIEAIREFSLVEENTGIEAAFTATVGDFGVTAAATIDRTAQRLLISQENLGDNDNLIVRVTGADLSMGNDIISIIKVRRGMAGANAITVFIESNDGTNNFTPGVTGPKTLTVRVYDQGSGAEITSGLTYIWHENTVDGDVVELEQRTTPYLVTQGTNIFADGDTDVNTASIVVDSNDTAISYLCVVTTDT